MKITNDVLTQHAEILESIERPGFLSESGFDRDTRYSFGHDAGGRQVRQQVRKAADLLRLCGALLPAQATEGPGYAAFLEKTLAAEKERVANLAEGNRELTLRNTNLVAENNRLTGRVRAMASAGDVSAKLECALSANNRQAQTIVAKDREVAELSGKVADLSQRLGKSMDAEKRAVVEKEKAQAEEKMLRERMRKAIKTLGGVDFSELWTGALKDISIGFERNYGPAIVPNKQKPCDCPRCRAEIKAVKAASNGG
jgi:hypothetical protein